MRVLLPTDWNIKWIKVYGVVVAEWLRRWTRNPLGSSRAGSNPADNEAVFPPKAHYWLEWKIIVWL